MENIICREARISDMDFIYQSLLDMATEEKIEARFYLNQEKRQKRLFGEKPLAEIILAEQDSKPVALLHLHNKYPRHSDLSLLLVQDFSYQKFFSFDIQSSKI